MSEKNKNIILIALSIVGCLVGIGFFVLFVVGGVGSPKLIKKFAYWLMIVMFLGIASGSIFGIVKCSKQLRWIYLEEKVC